MVRGREGHVYIIDSKTGELFPPENVQDGDLELVHGILEDLEEARTYLDIAEEEYGKERCMHFNVYEDGKKQIDGTEYFTTQASFGQF